MKTARITLPKTDKGEWYKHCIGVDKTKKDGFAFEGEFVNGGTQLEFSEGAVIINFYTEEGYGRRGTTWKKRMWMARKFLIDSNGIASLETICKESQEKFLDFRDAVAEALEVKIPSGNKMILERLYKIRDDLNVQWKKDGEYKMVFDSVNSACEWLQELADKESTK